MVRRHGFRFVLVAALLMMMLAGSLVSVSATVSPDLVNAGFETGDLSGWSTGTVVDYAGVVTADDYATPYEGDYMARLGTPLYSQPIGDNAIYQDFTATQANLFFAYNICTFDYTGFNHFHYLVTDLSTGETIAYYDQGAWGAGTDFKTTGWQEVNIDLSAHIGNQVRLEIDCGGTLDQLYASWAYVDGLQTIPVGTNLRLLKSGPASAYAGNDVAYTLHYYNWGDTAAENVVLTDTLPAGVEALTGQTTWNLGTVAALGSGNILIAVHIPDDAATNVTIVNQANISTTTNEVNYADNTAQASTEIVEPVVYVGIGKSATDAVKQGDELSYDIYVYNNSEVMAKNVTVTDTLPAGVQFVSADGAYIYDDVHQTVTWDLGNLGPNYEGYLNLIVRVSDSAPIGSGIENCAAISTTSNDTNSEDDYSCTSTTVIGGTNMIISKSGPWSKEAGSQMTYTIYYQNFGGDPAENVTIADNLPPEVEFMSASDSGSCSGSVVTWNIGTVDAMGSGSVTVTVQINDGATGTVTNTAQISTTTTEVNYDDNEASASTTITAPVLPPDVGVEPNNGGGPTPSVYWGNPVTFSYDSNPEVTGVEINIHIDDGGTDISGPMTGDAPHWTYTVTFYPRHGEATVTYTTDVDDCAPYTADFDARNMLGFNNNMITAAEINAFIQTNVPSSPMLSETNIGARFIDSGVNHQVNPAFLVATAYHEGVFGTQGWAASHPECHNSMGYGIPSGSTPPDSINCVGTWGDMIDRVANVIQNGDNYYTQNLFTVDQIRNKYAADPQTGTIVQYMNDLYESSGGCSDTVVFSIYIDPAGYIYNTLNGMRISGATVTLQQPDGFGGWVDVQVGEVPPIMQPDVNPLITGADGAYQWDTLPGTYRVHVEAVGYYPADSIAVTVPPPVTDLNVGLTPITPIPPVPELPAIALMSAGVLALGGWVWLRNKKAAADKAS